MLRGLALFAALLALAACGRTGDLRPADGAALPVRPAMAAETPDASALLTPPPYARPERIDELVKRSTPRAPDRFDLPPPEGGAAPAPDPIGDLDEAGPADVDITGPAPDDQKDADPQ